jgi:hypothetical protein
MKIEFPSSEFNEAVAAVCHGSISEEQSRALNELLRNNAAALDEYILRVELHSRLASQPDLFASTKVRNNPVFAEAAEAGTWNKAKVWTIALAACLALVAAGLWGARQFRPADRALTTSKAVAMLNRTADAQWNLSNEIPRLGAPLEPGSLRLESGLAEIIFYSGARMVVEGPAEVRLVSRNAAFLRRGRLVAEVPDQARGFQIETSEANLAEMGSSFGMEAKEKLTEAHAFKGNIRLNGQTLRESTAAIIESGQAARLIPARPAAFASLSDLEARSAAAGARRHDQWRKACQRLETDPSLLVHFDFENVAPSGWQLRNLGNSVVEGTDATLVGCQWTEGRWPEKRALEFQSVSDRVRLSVPGEFQALTLTAWVCVKGLDRKINSLFMSDGFAAGTIHWVIRRDGVLGTTVIGANPLDHQLIVSPRVITLDKFGTWLHLAVTLDGASRRVVHYVNGTPVDETPLKIAAPFRIGPAELGNWNAKGFPENDPFMIRNFSGAMDDFCVFGRALSAREIGALYFQGRPQLEPIAQKALVKEETNKP